LLCLIAATACNATVSGGEDETPGAGGSTGSGAGSGNGGSASGAGGTGAGGKAGSAGKGGSGGSTPIPPVGVRPPAGSCALPDPAFCETFDTAGTGIRARSVNPQRISVARVGPGANPPQSLLNQWRPANAVGCDGQIVALSPPNDYYLCPSSSGSHLRQAYDDDGNFTIHSIGIRQLFDFTDGGKFAFDVDGWFTPGHGTWLEVWVTDQPIPAPYQSAPGVEAVGRNAIGFELHADHCSQNATANGVHIVYVVNDYELRRQIGVNDLAQADCFTTQRLVFNHIEVRLTRNSMEVWASDAGRPTTLRRVALLNGVDFGFTRGFIHVQHSHYNAVKGNNPTSETHIYDNFAFDGPAYVLPRTYEIRDSLNPIGGAVNTGYDLSNGKIVSFEVPNVDVANAASGSLNVTGTYFEAGMTLRHRFNGGAWRSFPHPFPNTTDKWRSISAPITVSDLRAGTNTLEIQVEGSNLFTALANIDFQIIPSR
jgi:hypothetical protein